MDSTAFKKPLRIVRKRETAERVGYHPVHVMRKANDPDDDFPAPVQLGPRSVGFIEAEVEAWIERRMAERSCDKGNSETQSEGKTSDEPDTAPRNHLVRPGCRRTRPRSISSPQAGPGDRKSPERR